MHQGHGSQRMSKTRMFGTWEDHVANAQLTDTTHKLDLDQIERTVRFVQALGSIISTL